MFRYRRENVFTFSIIVQIRGSNEFEALESQIYNASSSSPLRSIPAHILELLLDCLIFYLTGAFHNLALLLNASRHYLHKPAAILHLCEKLATANMPSIKALITVNTTNTRIVELELSSPDMRSADIPQHIQHFLLRDDEILQSVKVIDTDPRLPNIKLGNPEATDGGPRDRSIPRTYSQAISEQTPRVHNWVFDQPHPTAGAESVDGTQLLWADKASSTTINNMPTQKYPSVNDSDAMRSVNIRDFAFERKVVKQDLLKTPLKPRTVHAKIMKPRSSTKEEKFQAQVKFYGLDTALKLKEKHEDRGRREFVKKAGTGRWKGTENSEGAKVSAITEMLKDRLHVNEKNKAYDEKPDNPSDSNDALGKPLPGSFGIDEARAFLGNNGKGDSNSLGPFKNDRDSAP